MNVRVVRFGLALLCWGGLASGTASAQWGYGDLWTSWYGPDWSSNWYTSYYAPTYSTYYAPSSAGWGVTSYYGGCSSCGSCGSCGVASVGYGCSSCGCAPCGCSPCNSCGSCYGGACNSCGVGSCGLACNSGCGTGNCSTGNCSSGNCGTGNCAPDASANWKGKLEPTPDGRSRGSIDPDPYAPPAGTRERDREPGPMRTFQEPSDNRRNPPADPNDSLFKGSRERTSPAGSGSGSGTTDPADKGLFGTESRRPVTGELETVKPKKADEPKNDDSRNYEKPVPANNNGSTVPGPMLNLESKITWRTVPERTRIAVRSGLSVPVVARKADDARSNGNSEWQTIGGETRIVRK